MKLHLKLVSSAVVLCASMAANAALFFDDLPDDIPLFEEYSGLGVHSDGASFVRAGLGNGDPGNWGLFGTNGSKFLGNNGDENYTTTLTFDSSLSWIDFDISRSNGSADGDTWEARVYDEFSALIQSQTGGFNPVNTWTNVAFSVSGIRRLEIQTFGDGFHPYGIDDVNLAPVPEPASLLIVGTGLVAFLRRRRAKA